MDNAFLDLCELLSPWQPAIFSSLVVSVCASDTEFKTLKLHQVLRARSSCGGKLDVVKELAARDANLEAKDNVGMTPIALAAEGGKLGRD